MIVSKKALLSLFVLLCVAGVGIAGAADSAPAPRYWVMTKENPAAGWQLAVMKGTKSKRHFVLCDDGSNVDVKDVTKQKATTNKCSNPRIVAFIQPRVGAIGPGERPAPGSTPTPLPTPSPTPLPYDLAVRVPSLVVNGQALAIELGNVVVVRAHPGHTTYTAADLQIIAYDRDSRPTGLFAALLVKLGASGTLHAKGPSVTLRTAARHARLPLTRVYGEDGPYYFPLVSGLGTLGANVWMTEKAIVVAY